MKKLFDMIPKSYVFLFLAVFLWGIHGPAGRFLALRGVDLYFIASFRVVAATVFLGVFLIIKGRFPEIAGKDWKYIAGLSIVGLFLNTIFYHLSLNWISGTLLMILENLSPVFVFILSYIFLKIIPSQKDIVALLLSMAGLGVIVYGKGGFSFQGSEFPGIILGVAAGFTFACYIFFSSKVVRFQTGDPVRIIQFIFRLFLYSSFLMIPFLFTADRKPITWSEWFWVVEMGVGQSALAYIFWNYALVDIPANKASVLFLFTIVFTSINEFVFLDLVLSTELIAGGLLIIISGRLITSRKKLT